MLGLVSGVTSNMSLDLTSFVGGLLGLGAFGVFGGSLDPLGQISEVGGGDLL
jgi:hypothetical protein